MSQISKARKVISAHVHLLHERRFGVDDPSRLEHSVELVDAAIGVEHMLQSGLDEGSVERRVREREVMPVANQGGARAKRDIGFNELDLRRSKQIVHALADDAPPHHQDLGLFSREKTRKTSRARLCLDT